MSLKKGLQIRLVILTFIIIASACSNKQKNIEKMEREYQELTSTFKEIFTEKDNLISEIEKNKNELNNNLSPNQIALNNKIDSTIIDIEKINNSINYLLNENKIFIDSIKKNSCDIKKAVEVWNWRYENINKENAELYDRVDRLEKLNISQRILIESTQQKADNKSKK